MHFNRAVQIAALRAIASLCKPSAGTADSKLPGLERFTPNAPKESVASRAQREFNAVSGIDVLLTLINSSLSANVRSHRRSIILDTNPLELFLACLMVVSIALAPGDARVVVSKCGGFAFLTEAVTAAIRRNIGKPNINTVVDDVYRWLRVVGSRRKINAGENAMLSNAQLITFLTVKS